MKNINIDNIQVHATSGSNLNNCIKDAIQLAVERVNNVELTHNADLYVINVSCIIDLVVATKKTIK